MVEEVMKEWVKLILEWHGQNIRRFAWREYRDWYRVLVAEVMLIRTRSTTVEKVYRLFINRFPNPEDLCQTDDEDIARFFKKLGLIQRAKRIKEVVCIVLEKYGGNLPCSYPDLVALPGIGRYIANVLLTRVCRNPTPFVDANILRFARRFLGLQEISITCVENWLIENVNRDLIEDICIALLDLASLNCLPRKPKCSTCPVVSFCKSGRTFSISDLEGSSNNLRPDV